MSSLPIQWAEMRATDHTNSPEAEMIPDTVVAGVSMRATIERSRRNRDECQRREEERIARIFTAAELLESAGIKSGVSTYSTYALCLGEVPRESLPALRRALGPMRVESKNVSNSRKRLINVHLRFKNHPDVSCYYERKMPRRKKGEPDSVRCRIVRNVKIEHVLICETD